MIESFRIADTWINIIDQTKVYTRIKSHICKGWYTPDQYEMACKMGYSDCPWLMSVEHELAHTLVAVKLCDLSYSPVLFDVARGITNVPEHHAEEALVLSFQTWARAHDRSILDMARNLDESRRGDRSVVATLREAVKVSRKET